LHPILIYDKLHRLDITQSIYAISGIPKTYKTYKHQLLTCTSFIKYDTLMTIATIEPTF